MNWLTAGVYSFFPFFFLSLFLVFQASKLNKVCPINDFRLMFVKGVLSRVRKLVFYENQILYNIILTYIKEENLIKAKQYFCKETFFFFLLQK